MHARTLVILTGLTATASIACDRPGAYGDANALIVSAANELWAEAGDAIQTALEPTILTVRNERTFRVTYQDPLDRHWPNLRRFRQVVVVGEADDAWVSEALAQVRPRPVLDPPQILQAQNVWARGQVVTILLLSPGGGAQDVLELVEPLHELLDAQFRQYAVSRMFLTGPDTALANSLQGTAGFLLALPRVYRWDRQDSVFRFRNDNPDPSELIREVTVTWRTPIPEEMPRDSIVSWRLQLAQEYFNFPQLVDLARSEETRGTLAGREVRELQAVWANPPDLEWPAGGPFITRVVSCPDQDRAYLLDAWLYAPGKDKYEYMIQLETILNSFRCGEGIQGAA